MNSSEQRIVIVAGPPATGKTSTMIHVIRNLQRRGQEVAVAKIDCLETEDDERYASLDIAVVVGLSNDICPDHYFAVNLEEIVSWSRDKKADILIIETAGLCHRCAPGIYQALNICVVDCLSSIKVPQKIGPVLTTADIIIITKGDIVSQMEKEVFWEQIRRINREAIIVEAGGLNGEGSENIARLIMKAKTTEGVSGDRLRHSMPTAICSYCMGETRIGNEYQHGVVYKMDFKRERIPARCLAN